MTLAKPEKPEDPVIQDPDAPSAPTPEGAPEASIEPPPAPETPTETPPAAPRRDRPPRVLVPGGRMRC